MKRPINSSVWKDEYGLFTLDGQYKTLRQLEFEGWKFDFDGKELKKAMSPDDSKFSINGTFKSTKKKIKKNQ